MNPEVLRWARESLGIPVEDVAERMKKTVDIIEAWERGDETPTYVQLETLAYDLYKRPVALFFFPEVPREEEPTNALRAMPSDTVSALPPRIRWLIRKVSVLQSNVAELRSADPNGVPNILSDLDFSDADSIVEMAERTREYLGVAPSDQSSWPDPDAAFKRWRAVLEDAGVAVFKDSFRSPGRGRSADRDDRYSGFCLYDPAHPVICVNNNDAKSRQVFTLFHELGHLLMRTGAVDLRSAEHADFLSGGDPSVEERCNGFAGEFLVPSADLAARIAGREPDEEAVADWAAAYSVSRAMILRRLRDTGNLSRSGYERRVRRLNEGRGSSSSGGNFYLTKGAYLGERYVEAVLKRHYEGRFSLREAAEYFQVSIHQVAGMEAWLFSQKGWEHDGPGNRCRTADRSVSALLPGAIPDTVDIRYPPS